MSLRVLPHLRFVGKGLRRIGVNSFLKCLVKFPVKPPSPGPFFFGRCLVTDSMLLLVTGLFRFSISSWFSLGKLYVSKNFSISSRLSSLLIYLPVPRGKDHAANSFLAFSNSATSMPLSSSLAGLGGEQVLVGAGPWVLDPAGLGSDPSLASIHCVTPGRASHIFEPRFTQLYTELQQSWRIIMMTGLGHRDLKKKELGVYGPRQVHSAGVRPQSSRRAWWVMAPWMKLLNVLLKGTWKKERRKGKRKVYLKRLHSP